MRRSTVHRRRALAAALATALGQGAAMAADPPAPDAALIEAGRRIYEQGVLPSGRPLEGVRPGGFEVEGREAACILCHQRSGMGLAEGAIPVPPVSAPALFRNERPAPLGRAPRRAPGIQFKDFPFRTRPPYDDESLEQAMREGVSPSGHVFSYMMPRYALSESDMKALIAYLHALSDAPSPGADGALAHFATAVAPGMDPARREAYLGVLKACFEERHPEPKPDPAAPATSGTQQAWRLHVWELEGTPDTWERQLQDKYALEPVFAMVSGLGMDEWAPVERFCEANRLPCLFPNVEVPGSATGGVYSFYFFKGVLLEAEVLARYLSDSRERLGLRRVVQVSRSDGSEAKAAAALRGALSAAAIDVETRHLEPSAIKPTAGVLAGIGKQDAVVLWLRETDLAALVKEVKTPPDAGVLLLSGMLGGLEHAPLTPEWRKAALMVYPFDPPYRRDFRMAYNLRPWLEQHDLPRTDEPLMGNTLAACNLLAEGMLRLRGRFVRDYLVESTENYPTGMGNAPAPEAFPRFSLGPGQRFSSKGAYIARFAAPEFQRLEQAEDWIVP